MKKLLNISLIITLTLNTAGSLSYAGPKEEALDYVAKSEEAARVTAENRFFDYLRTNIEKAAASIPNGKNYIEINESINYTKSKIGELVSKFNDSFGRVKNADGADVLELYENLNNLYSDIRALERIRDRQILAGVRVSSTIGQGIEQVTNQILKVCEEGFAENVNMPELPPVRPVIPQYKIEMSIYGNDSGVAVAPPSFEAHGAKTEWVAPAAAVATAFGAGLHGYLATGSLAAFSSGASLTTGALAMGAGFGLAVGLTAYAISMEQAIEESREVTDAMWIVFDRKADAQTVKQEFKKLCEPLVSRLQNLPQKFEKIVVTKDAAAIADYKKQSDAVDKAMNELVQLNQLMKKKEDVLIEESKKLPEDQRAAFIEKGMHDSEERANYINFLKNQDQDIPFDMLEVAFIKILTEQKTMESSLQTYFDSLFKSQVQSFAVELGKLAQVVRNLSIKKEVRDMIREETTIYTEVGAAYREFDGAFSQYIKELFALGQTVNARIRLAAWVKKVNDLVVKYPTSKAAKVLQNEASQIVKILGLGNEK